LVYRDYASPHECLEMYKHSVRPRPCDRCGNAAYYYHGDFGYLCASHLLDLCNIGEIYWQWNDYPEVWARCNRLLMRPPSSTANLVTDYGPPANMIMKQLDGLKERWDEEWDIAQPNIKEIES